MSGILYVTGTPIGNLSDLSPRAVETLESVDFIAAEDTRVTLKLLNHFGIKKPMVSYFEHNKRERGEIICARIEQGEKLRHRYRCGYAVYFGSGRRFGKALRRAWHKDGCNSRTECGYFCACRFGP